MLSFKHVARFTAVLMLVLGTSTYSSQTLAADIVVVDIQRLETMSTAGKSLRKKIKAKRDALKTEVTKQEKVLTSERTKIIEAQKKLSEKELKAKVKAFEASYKDKQARIAKKRTAFEKSALEAHGKLRAEVVSVVGEISTTNKYKLVLSRQNVVIVEKTLDITAEAMKKLNAKVQSIPLK
ncbi:MAG: OmpH family outer membrane protein [Alphaproteobacteria bacterium]|nr:OmpH family outer membrane protein [Alphaproteobacteria bacterium]